MRARREGLGFTIRDVEAASQRLADAQQNPELAISLSRLSDIETKSLTPSIFKIYSLAIIYRLDYLHVLEWYGLHMADAVRDRALAPPPRTHLATAAKAEGAVKAPVALEPGFDARQTTDIGRMIQAWGIVPLEHLAQLSEDGHSYGYIGTEDLMMYPLLPPGSFVQIDEKRTRVVERIWRSEYERPIYFVETRNGFWCCWCAVQGSNLILQPHPLSPAQVRVFQQGSEAEVIGQVVGVAMRLGAVQLIERPKESQLLN